MAKNVHNTLWKEQFQMFKKGNTERITEGWAVELSTPQQRKFWRWQVGDNV